MDSKSQIGRDLFILLLVLIICFQSIEIKYLKRDVKTLIEGEHLQNEINNEIIKRIYLQSL